MNNFKLVLGFGLIGALASCATVKVPAGYEGADFNCMFQGQECVDQYVREVNHLRSLTLEEKRFWYQTQRDAQIAERQALEDIGNAFGGFADQQQRFYESMQPKQPKVIVIDQNGRVVEY
jgi:hypothetical protein